MSPLISEPLPPTPVPLQLVTLGPLALPMLKGEITETVGDQLETVGTGVVAGDRGARPLTLRIPLRGDRLDPARWEAGLRLRRQVRALLENSLARMQGLYLNWSVDPELNGWLLIGGGEIKYATGGITFADFELELTGCYRIGTRRTHRPARRIVNVDRRLVTTPRDILSTLYSTDFASTAFDFRSYLGVGITDPVAASTRVPAGTTWVVTKDGDLRYSSAPDGEVIDFEQPEADMHKAIVRIHDTHGSPDEARWGAVYGPDQPIEGALRVDNAVCRVVPDLATGLIDVQSWSGSAWVTDATVAHPAGATAFAARVVEWTTERAVLCITSTLYDEWSTPRGEMYISLQRGWSGPRIELYAKNAQGSATASLNVYAKSSGEATYQRSDNIPTAIVSGTSIGTFTGLQPWVALLGPGTDPGVSLAVLQEAVNLRGAALSGREGLAFESPTGYVSVTLGIGPRADVVSDATKLGRRNMVDMRTVPELVARN